MSLVVVGHIPYDHNSDVVVMFRVRRLYVVGLSLLLLLWLSSQWHSLLERSNVFCYCSCRVQLDVV